MPLSWLWRVFWTALSSFLASTRVKHWPTLAASTLLLSTMIVAGCSFTSSSTSSSATHSPSSASTTSTTPGNGATATPGAQPPTHALAWYQYDSLQVPQIWASINGASPRQITHVAPDHAACDDQGAWGLPVFSPDMTHIVTALGSADCGDATLNGEVVVVDVTSGGVTTVPGNYAANSIRLTQRVDGWINASTLWFISYGGLFTYTLGATSTTLVAALHDPEDAVLRGSTLFWLTSTSGGGGSGTFSLRRFDISSHTDLGTAISLGTVGTCGCSPGDYGLPGWDVSADGSRVAYQLVTPAAGPAGGIASAQFYAADADGSGISRIASYVATTHLATLLISPNGQLVSIAWALPSPSVITASMTSAGQEGDPYLHVYSPDGEGFAVWKWDSSSFWVETHAPGSYGGSGSTPSIYLYTVSSSSSMLSVANGLNPWYTVANA